MMNMGRGLSNRGRLLGIAALFVILAGVGLWWMVRENMTKEIVYATEKLGTPELDGAVPARIETASFGLG